MVPLKHKTMVLLVVLLCGAAQAFEAGVGKAEITPPLGTPLNGYGDRLGRGALAIHDPLWARCLYLNDGKTAVLLVTSDLCLINRELRERVLELAPREVPRENIILTATHTHSAQGGMIQALPFRSVSGRFVPEVLEQTARGFAEAMRAAYDNRKRAAVGYGTGEQRVLSTNRRYPGGPIDPQIGVIRVDDADAIPMAIVANFAAHPTMVGGDDKYSVSADYPGFFYTTLERLAPPGCVAMFMNGAEGNQRPANPEGKDGWDRIESIGRLLAERVKEIANTITCGDVTLHVGHATPDLPLAMAGRLIPTSTVLKTLEINDLLLTFLPGEPCVEIGLELRKQALERGYTAQFTVGLGNDYLAYFAPVEYYCHMHYETSANLFGPRAAQWLYHEFAQLMTRGDPEPGPGAVAPASVQTIDGARYVALGGSMYAIGQQRGRAFRDEILLEYEANVAGPIAAGALIPAEGYWRMAAPYLNLSTLALPALGIGARPLLQGVSNGVIDEVAGMAEAVGLPFDALWLVQCTPTFAARGAVDDFYRTAFCTMFASAGLRAGVDDLLVGRNFDWADDDAPVVLDIQPEEGHRFVQIGFAWNAGVFTGMNDAGLVLCAERVEGLGRPPDAGAPVEFVLRDLLQHAASVDEAVARFRNAPAPRGYHVLVAGPAGPSACVVQLGATATVRKPVNGFLLGADPEDGVIDAAAKIRYTRVQELLAGEHLITSARIRDALADRQDNQDGQERIFNDDTKCSVVFRPKEREVHVAFPDGSGAPGKYTVFSLKGDGP